jgi:hypothetical protein
LATFIPDSLKMPFRAGDSKTASEGKKKPFLYSCLGHQMIPLQTEPVNKTRISLRQES